MNAADQRNPQRDVTCDNSQKESEEGDSGNDLVPSKAEKSLCMCQGEACRDGNWRYRHVDLVPVIVPATSAFVRTEELCFRCCNQHQGVTSSKRSFQREQGIWRQRGKLQNNFRVMGGWNTSSAKDFWKQ